MQLSGAPVNLSASGAVSLTPGTLIGFLVNSVSGGSVQFKDGGTAGTAVTAALIPAATGFIPCYIAFSTSCYATIVGTINITAVFSNNC